MKKHPALGLNLLFSLSMILVSPYSFSSQNNRNHDLSKQISCKTVLIRASEHYMEPYQDSKILISLTPQKGKRTLSGSTSLDFKFKNLTNKTYRLDIQIVTKNSNWSTWDNPNITGFKTHANLWDTNKNKLIGSVTHSSDEVYTYYMLNKVLKENKPLSVFKVHNLNLRSKLLTSSSEKVQEHAKKGEWLEASATALQERAIDPFEAEFVSLACELIH